MSVLSKLASASGIKSEEPNKLLAAELVKSGNKKAIKELADNLNHKDKNIQSDCIKVLYEIGQQEPALIAEYDAQFLELLQSKNNRMVWGAMTALDGIAAINPHGIYKQLSKILDVAQKGSVITKDHGVGILIKLASHKKYTDTALVLLLDLMKDAPGNQLPKYAEDTIPVMTDQHKKTFVKVLTARLDDFEKETKKVRLQKVIKKWS